VHRHAAFTRPRRARATRTAQGLIEGRHELGFFSDREPDIAVDDLLPQQRPLARTPERHAMHGTINERAAIGREAALRRPRNSDEFGFELGRRRAHGRVTVAAEIGECVIRRAATRIRVLGRNGRGGICRKSSHAPRRSEARRSQAKSAGTCGPRRRRVPGALSSGPARGRRGTQNVERPERDCVNATFFDATSFARDSAPS
jgi:hypothetical protein